MPKKRFHYEYLRDRWTKKHKNLAENLVKKHKKSFEWLSQNSKQLALGSLGGLLILTTPFNKGHTGPELKITSEEEQKIGSNVFLVTDLGSLLPSEVRPLSKEEEEKIGEVLSKSFGLNIKADIQGLRLNRTYGIIGAEQHLRRFPQDNMFLHFDNEEDRSSYFSSGMAPGLGAFGYFATSAAHLTGEDIAREKYYIAVQTFLSPDFNLRVAEYRDFFKFRKMLIVNPENGKAIVAVIGDAGPAEWTGKHLGGSPEVMKHLERVDGSMKGPVLYFFIDDPENNVPLGPIDPIGS